MLEEGEGNNPKKEKEKKSLVGNRKAVFDFVLSELKPNKIKWEKSESYIIS